MLNAEVAVTHSRGRAVTVAALLNAGGGACKERHFDRGFPSKPPKKPDSIGLFGNTGTQQSVEYAGADLWFPKISSVQLA